jgi:hypothetical protein
MSAKRPQNNSVKAEFNRIEAASTPWWAHGFSVFFKCIMIAVLPLRIAVLIAEAAVAFAFVAFGVTLYLVYKQIIPDSFVAEQLSYVGGRLLGIVQSSGVL